MLVIFDLDGTLLNTLDDLTEAANHALQKGGFPGRTTEECRRFVGNGIAKLLERALPPAHQTAENVEQLKTSFLDYYGKHLTDFTRPYQGMEEVLAALGARGYQLAVASNKYQRATEYLIQYFFPKIPFVAVLGQRAGIAVKPHPQIVQDILTIAQENREHTIYVGDSEVDMQTAQNAGVKVCAVTWGFRGKASLAAYRPAYFIDKPCQLLQII